MCIKILQVKYLYLNNYCNSDSQSDLCSTNACSEFLLLFSHFLCSWECFYLLLKSPYLGFIKFIQFFIDFLC